MEMLKNKKIGIIGLGISNLYLANYLLNFTDKIFITEQQPKEKIENLNLLHPSIICEFGGHSEKILESDIIIRSPGISYNHPLLKKIVEKKIPVFTELEISYKILIDKLKTSPFIVAITGTNGKTTTTTLTGKIFSSFKKTIVAGNIGIPLIKFIDEITKDTLLVLEVSSYQLEDIREFKPHIGCILNITEDHLEHHLTMESYISAKFNIFKNQKKDEFAVLKYEDENIKLGLTKHSINSSILYFSATKENFNGCWLSKDKTTAIIKFNKNYEEIKVRTKLLGLHNYENILASVLCAYLAGIPKEIIEKAVSEFEGVEHRLEIVRIIDGVVYINDSKSTNVDSTLVALKSIEQPIHLILGGRDKGSPYTPLIPLINQKVKSILLIGEATETIYNQLKDTNSKIFRCETLKNAVIKAKEISKSGDVVLLSPACSSFDQFKNFEHRGKIFKEIVNTL
ncbi:MAG: UDP-N-acetylmuramoyl-L-alanine--D-glutamate ligase [Endomicrobiia bacterium]